MPRRQRRRKYNPEQENELAQAMLDGLKSFSPDDQGPPTIDPTASGFERALEDNYRAGWLKAQKLYDEHQETRKAENQRLDAPVKPDTRPASSRQTDYMNSLIKEHSVSWEQAQDELRARGHATPPERAGKLTMEQADQLLDWLTNFPRRQCNALTKADTPCTNNAVLLEDHCSTHNKKQDT